MKKILFLLFCSSIFAQAPGDLIQSYGPAPGLDGVVRSIIHRPDGKMLVAGNFTTYNGVIENRIILLNPDGTKDTSFNSGTGFNSGGGNLGVMAMALQSDGKIIVGGDFTTYNGVTENRVIRLNSNGTKDISFNPITGINTSIWTIAIQNDGKILLGGDSGAGINHIIRLNVDGTIDNTFNFGNGFNNPVRTIALQSDGKIVVAGSFSTYKGVTVNRIIRLNVDGAIDSTFNMGTGFNSTVYSLVIQPNGKILVGGNFTVYNGISENRIIRLNSDGTKDTNFNSGSGFNGFVWTIALQIDGKIIVGGDFLTYNSVTQNRIIRLNSDGTKDLSFNSGTGFNTTVSNIVSQSDGKILIGGHFTTYRGFADSAYLIKIHGVNVLSNQDFIKENNLVVWPNPVQNVLNIENGKNQIYNLSIIDLQGKLINETINSTTIDVSCLLPGSYIVKIKTENEFFIKKIVKE